MSRKIRSFLLSITCTCNYNFCTRFSFFSIVFLSEGGVIYIKYAMIRSTLKET